MNDEKTEEEKTIVIENNENDENNNDEIKQQLFVNGFEVKVGEKLEAADESGKWYPAKIVSIDHKASEILIHFERWSNRYDRWINMNSEMLRARANSDKDISGVSAGSGIGNQDCSANIDNNCSNNIVYSHKVFKEKDHVLARWTDGKKYPGVIANVFADGSYFVSFYDGYKKKVKPNYVDELPENYEGVWIPPNMDSASLITSVSSSSTDALALPPCIIGTEKPSKVTTIFPVARKEFKIEEDHNHFKCSVEGCGKGFRKEKLLNSHVKHYHPELIVKEATSVSSSPITTPAPSECGSIIQDNLPSKPSPKPMKSIHKIKRDRSAESEAGKVKDEVKGSKKIKTDTHESKSDEIVIAKSSTTATSTIATTPFSKKKKSHLYVKIPTQVMKSSNKSQSAVLQKAASKQSDMSSGVNQEKEKTSAAHSSQAVTLETSKNLKRKRKSKNTDDSPNSSATSTGEMLSYLKKDLDTAELSDHSQASLSKRGRTKKKVDIVASTSSDTNTTQTLVTPIRKSDRKPKEKDEYSDGLLSEFLMNDERPIPNTVLPFWDARTISDIHESDDVDELVHCTCDLKEESGLMIQCEVCLTWQHGMCFEIDSEQDVPDPYICFCCRNPRLVREQMRSKFDQEWLKKGKMESLLSRKIFDSSTEREYENEVKQSNSSIEQMKITNQLLTSVYEVMNVLSGLRYKVSLLKQMNESVVSANDELKLFKTSWVTKNKEDTSENHLNESINITSSENESEHIDTNIKVNDQDIISDILNLSKNILETMPSTQTHDVSHLPEDLRNELHDGTDLISFITSPYSKANEPSALKNETKQDFEISKDIDLTNEYSSKMLSNDCNERKKKLTNESKNNSMETNDEEDSQSTIVDESYKDQNHSGVSNGINKQFIMNKEMKNEIKVEADKCIKKENNSEDKSNSENEFNICKRNLLDHILDLQSKVGERLNLIELKLNELAIETDGGKSTFKSDPDLMAFKDSIKDFFKDLDVVKNIVSFRE